MPTAQPNLFTRDDTIFGVCQGLGEDLGFNPNILRLALPILLFLNPLATIGGYALAGAIVFGARWIAPVTVRTTANVNAGAASVTDGTVTADNDAERLPIAA